MHEEVGQAVVAARVTWRVKDEDELFTNGHKAEHSRPLSHAHEESLRVRECESARGAVLCSHVQQGNVAMRVLLRTSVGKCMKKSCAFPTTFLVEVLDEAPRKSCFYLCCLHSGTFSVLQK